MLSITKKFEFEAAHQLSPREVFGKCADVHGHTYKLEIEVTADSKMNGMIMNFSDLSKIVKENIIELVDHKFLNAVFERPTTAEEMVEAFRDIINAHLPTKIELIRIRLYETSNSFAQWIK